MTDQDKSYTAGREYAIWCRDHDKGAEPVDIEGQLMSSTEMPDGDYTELRRAGVEPDARAYWEGYGSVAGIE